MSSPQENALLEPMDFDLEPIRIPVTIKWKDQKTKKDRTLNGVLTEASGEASKKYRNMMLGCMTLGPEGKPSKVLNLASTEPYLVALCLYEVVKDEKTGEEIDKPVPQTLIESLPSRVQKQLYQRIKEISDLEEESPEKQTLEEALSRPDAPISLVDFRKWVSALPDEEGEFDYRPLKKWMRPSAEELAKNERSDTESISS